MSENKTMNPVNEENLEQAAGGFGGLSNAGVTPPPKVCPFCHKEVEFMVMSAGVEPDGTARPHGIYLCPNCNKGINF